MTIACHRCYVLSVYEHLIATHEEDLSAWVASLTSAAQALDAERLAREQEAEAAVRAAAAVIRSSRRHGVATRCHCGRPSVDDLPCFRHRNEAPP